MYPWQTVLVLKGSASYLSEQAAVFQFHCSNLIWLLMWHGIRHWYHWQSYRWQIRIRSARREQEEYREHIPLVQPLLLTMLLFCSIPKYSIKGQYNLVKHYQTKIMTRHSKYWHLTGKNQNLLRCPASCISCISSEEDSRTNKMVFFVLLVSVFAVLSCHLDRWREK